MRTLGNRTFPKDKLIYYEDPEGFGSAKKMYGAAVSSLFPLVNETSIDIPLEEFYAAIPHEISPKWGDKPIPVKAIYYPEIPNRWIENSLVGGWYKKDEGITIRIKKGSNPYNIEMIYVLLHEFRHHLQEANPVIGSNVYNKNMDKFREFMMRQGISESDFEHVFHEINPYEVDANMFACEALGIPYPGSGFAITDSTLEILQESITKNYR